MIDAFALFDRGKSFENSTIHQKEDFFLFFLSLIFIPIRSSLVGIFRARNNIIERRKYRSNGNDDAGGGPMLILISSC